MMDVDAGDAPPVVMPPDGAPTIGVLDSAINDHPLLEGLILGRFAGSGIANTADVWGQWHAGRGYGALRRSA
jgi:hypothetical protein